MAMTCFQLRCLRSIDHNPGQVLLMIRMSLGLVGLYLCWANIFLLFFNWFRSILIIAVIYLHLTNSFTFKIVSKCTFGAYLCHLIGIFSSCQASNLLIGPCAYSSLGSYGFMIQFWIISCQNPANKQAVPSSQTWEHFLSWIQGLELPFLLHICLVLLTLLLENLRLHFILLHQELLLLQLLLMFFMHLLRCLGLCEILLTIKILWRQGFF